MLAENPMGEVGAYKWVNLKFNAEINRYKNASGIRSSRFSYSLTSYLSLY